VSKHTLTHATYFRWGQDSPTHRIYASENMLLIKMPFIVVVACILLELPPPTRIRFF